MNLTQLKSMLTRRARSPEPLQIPTGFRANGYFPNGCRAGQTIELTPDTYVIEFDRINNLKSVTINWAPTLSIEEQRAIMEADIEPVTDIED